MPKGFWVIGLQGGSSAVEGVCQLITWCGLGGKLLLHSLAAGPWRASETFIMAIMIVVISDI